MTDHIFKSERLGFRNWRDSDIPELAQMNRDPEVMEFFPRLKELQETESFVKQMKEQFKKHGFCYFAVDSLSDNAFIGFIGIAEQTFTSDFTPCVDIGWRLSRRAWNKGYATEGARRCLDYAFIDIGLSNVKAICPSVNLRSERVMQKIGMKLEKTFLHPLLSDCKELESCKLYEVENPYV